MKALTQLMLVLLTTIILTACSTQETATETPTPTPVQSQSIITLTTSGSGSVTPILATIAEQFEADNPGYILEVLPGSGTGGGVRGAVDGTLDIAAMSRPPKDSEAEQGIEFTAFGTSVTAIMAHPDVSVTELTSEQLTDIFTGNVTNWSEVGGADLEIAVYLRDPEEGNTKDIREAFVGESEFAESAQILTSQTEMQNLLSSVEGAIGYGTWATALANEADVISLTIDEVSVDNPSEEIVGTMGIGYLSDRVDDIQPLINWLLSEEGQTALQVVGVSPIVSG